MPLEAIQPHRYDELLEEKARAVNALLAHLNPPAPTVFRSAPTGYRMRAEFRIWHDGEELDYVMFRPGMREHPVRITDFPVACERIQSLMPTLRALLRANPALRHKLFQAEFLSSVAGDTLVTLVYHRHLDENWQQQAEVLAAALDIAIVGRSRKQKRVVRSDYINEVLRIHQHDYHYRQYEQAFTQPNAGVNTCMIEWSCDHATALGGDLLELYCGNGNFTLPLSRHFGQVIATELAKSSIRAARENIAANAIDNVQVVRLAAEEVSQAVNGLREFRRLAELPQPLADYDLHTVFVDPPRAGLDQQTLEMASNFDNILYISCNPVTLAANLETLDHTHRITAFAQFDQFPYTSHMECGMLLQRR
jgi:tRNA (uracil-5-)-methyltransferase